MISARDVTLGRTVMFDEPIDETEDCVAALSSRLSGCSPYGGDDGMLWRPKRAAGARQAKNISHAASTKNPSREGSGRKGPKMIHIWESGLI